MGDARVQGVQQGRASVPVPFQREIPRRAPDLVQPIDAVRRAKAHSADPQGQVHGSAEDFHERGSMRVHQGGDSLLGHPHAASAREGGDQLGAITPASRES